MMIFPMESKDMPPKAFLLQVLNDVAKVYVHLWERRNRKNEVFLLWEEILKTYNRNNFRTSLRKLCNHGLISYQETSDGVCIELVGWEDLAEMT